MAKTKPRPVSRFQILPRRKPAFGRPQLRDEGVVAYEERSIGDSQHRL